jgi:hypothetical protein
MVNKLFKAIFASILCLAMSATIRAAGMAENNKPDWGVEAVAAARH